MLCIATSPMGLFHFLPLCMKEFKVYKKGGIQVYKKAGFVQNNIKVHLQEIGQISLTKRMNKIGGGRVVKGKTKHKGLSKVHVILC